MIGKKLLAGGIVLLACTFVYGQSWTKESVQFQFPTSSVLKYRARSVEGFRFSGITNQVKRTVQFTFALPQDAKDAVITVNALNGTVVKKIALVQGAKTVSWDYSAGSIAMGAYTASLTCGAIEKNLRLMIVK